MECKWCGRDEDRINGYCSHDCEGVHDVLIDFLDWYAKRTLDYLSLEDVVAEYKSGKERE